MMLLNTRWFVALSTSGSLQNVSFYKYPGNQKVGDLFSKKDPHLQL